MLEVGEAAAEVLEALVHQMLMVVVMVQQEVIVEVEGVAALLLRTLAALAAMVALAALD